MPMHIYLQIIPCMLHPSVPDPSYRKMSMLFQKGKKKSMQARPAGRHLHCRPVNCRQDGRGPATYVTVNIHPSIGGLCGERERERERSVVRRPAGPGQHSFITSSGGTRMHACRRGGGGVTSQGRPAAGRHALLCKQKQQ